MIDRMSDTDRSRRRGPGAQPGRLTGPDEVRRAVLDAAVALFAVHGFDAVSLSDIAAAADVNLSLIGRYIGRRDELVAEVFRHVSDQLAQAFSTALLCGCGPGRCGTAVQVGGHIEAGTSGRRRSQG
jgi:AcrR family transcriptional regulator